MHRGSPLFLSLLRELGLEDRYRVDTLQREWSALFGEPLSLHTCPSGLKEGELLVTVDSPLWLQQLKFFKEEMLKRLQSFGVRTIRFRHGSIYASRRRGPGHTTPQSSPPALPSRPLDDADRTWIEQTIASIADEELRETLARAMEKALSRPRRPQR